MHEHDDLILACLDGRLDAEHVDRFQQLFMTDDAFVERFAALSILNSQLTEGRVMQRPLPIAPSTAAPEADLSAPRAKVRVSAVPRSEFRVPSLIYPVAAALLLAAAAVAIYLLAFDHSKSETRNPKLGSPIVTVLDTAPGSTLVVDDTILSPGDEIHSGELSLDTGSAEFRLSSGVTVSLRGPSRLTVHDPMHATLAHGSATFDCPHTATGYTVHLPDGTRVIDLGTVFTVDAAPPATRSNMHIPSAKTLRVRCSEGLIRVIPSFAGVDTPALLLERGQQVTIDPQFNRIATGSFVAEGSRISIHHVRSCNTAGEAGSPEGETVEHAVDNDFVSKYVNGNMAGAGLVVYPTDGLSIVRGLTLTAASDHAERDPARFMLEGSNDGGVTWSAIASGSVPVFATRFASQTLSFDNNTFYGAYRLTFPTVVDPAAADSVQIAEVEFVADQILPDATQPGMSVQAYNLAGEPRPNDPTESVDRAIDDDPSTKYLNFNTAGAGLTITLDAPTIVRGVGLCTANDDPNRDPTAFTLQGSDDGEHFVDIVTDVPVAAIADRHFQRNFAFDNNKAYRDYRLIFTRVADQATANRMQIAEIQLFAESPPPGNGSAESSDPEIPRLPF